MKSSTVTSDPKEWDFWQYCTQTSVTKLNNDIKQSTVHSSRYLTSEINLAQNLSDNASTLQAPTMPQERECSIKINQYNQSTKIYLSLFHFYCSQEKEKKYAADNKHFQSGTEDMSIIQIGQRATEMDYFQHFLLAATHLTLSILYFWGSKPSS